MFQKTLPSLQRRIDVDTYRLTKVTHSADRSDDETDTVIDARRAGPLAPTDGMHDAVFHHSDDTHSRCR
jgi:hypothetical protein